MYETLVTPVSSYENLQAGNALLILYHPYSPQAPGRTKVYSWQWEERKPRRNTFYITGLLIANLPSPSRAVVTFRFLTKDAPRSECTGNAVKNAPSTPVRVLRVESWESNAAESTNAGSSFQNFMYYTWRHEKSPSIYSCTRMVLLCTKIYSRMFCSVQYPKLRFLCCAVRTWFWRNLDTIMVGLACWFAKLSIKTNSHDSF